MQPPARPFAPTRGPDIETWAALAEVTPADWEAHADTVAALMGADGVRAPARVGRSALVSGVASRLWSALLVPWVTTGAAPPASAVRLRVERGIELGLADVEPVALDAPAMREVWLGLLDGAIGSLRLAPRLQWGNVAASLAAAPRVFGLPQLIDPVGAWLREPPLAGELLPRSADDPRQGLVRATCCLFYEAPGGGLCGDCPLG